jgi:hypothetical protein
MFKPKVQAKVQVALAADESCERKVSRTKPSILGAEAHYVSIVDIFPPWGLIGQAFLRGERAKSGTPSGATAPDLPGFGQ